jgi:hypothetical protein
MGPTSLKPTSLKSLFNIILPSHFGYSKWPLFKTFPPFKISFARAVCKVRGLTLLLRARTLWRCRDGLFFEVPPLASDALLTMLHPLFENVLQTVDHFEISCLGVPFSWLEKPINCMRRDLDCMEDVLTGFHLSTFSKPNIEFNSDLAPCDFWAFTITKMELRGDKFQSDQRSAARFREVGGALKKVHCLPREVLRKRGCHRTSTKFRLGLTESTNFSNCPRTSVRSIYPAHCNVIDWPQ